MMHALPESEIHLDNLLLSRQRSNQEHEVDDESRVTDWKTMFLFYCTGICQFNLNLLRIQMVNYKCK